MRVKGYTKRVRGKLIRVSGYNRVKKRRVSRRRKKRK